MVVYKLTTEISGPGLINEKKYHCPRMFAYNPMVYDDASVIEFKSKCTILYETEFGEDSAAFVETYTRMYDVHPFRDFLNRMKTLFHYGV